MLYAVKACSEPAVLQVFLDNGIQHFDCASLTEVEIVRLLSDDATCYFMVPVRIRGEAKAAAERFGVRHFVVDHLSGLPMLAKEIDLSKSVVFARMAVHHDAAMSDLSLRFGARPENVPELMAAIAATGAEPALAFNVGSSVTDPAAYRHGLQIVADVLGRLPSRLRLLDVGGGFPRSYPGFEMPPLHRFFDDITGAVANLELRDGGEIMCEPGRALAAPGMSAVCEILQRRGERLYLNDGMHGIFWELRYPGHDRYPVRTYRGGLLLEGATRDFRLYGPTCDSEDILPGAVSLPADIDVGDHIEFGRLGAYSLSGRTDFNGRYSRDIVIIDGNDAMPPGHREYQN